MSAESERHVEAVLAALRILESYESDVGLRPTDIQERTGLQYSRVMRLLGTLAARGFLFLETETGRYHLGPSLLRLSGLLQDRHADILQAVRPALRSLVSATGMTALFSVPLSHSRLVLCKEEPATALRYTVREGQPRPMHQGASGRVMLAHIDEDTSRAILNDLDEGVAKQLKSRLAKIRDQAHDASISELTAGAFAVACPVLRANSELIGVLTLAGPSANLTAEQQDQYLQQLRHHAAMIPGSWSGSADRPFEFNSDRSEAHGR